MKSEKNRLSNDKTTLKFIIGEKVDFVPWLSIFSWGKNLINRIEVGTLRRSLCSCFLGKLRILVRIELVGVTKLKNNEIIRLHCHCTTIDIALLIHLFPMNSFCTPWKHQKTFRFCNKIWTCPILTNFFKILL